MASHRDFEKLWEQYQKDGAKRDITIARYCKNHGIVYAHFERWYRSYFRKRAYEVEITNAPEIDTAIAPQKAASGGFHKSKRVDDSKSEIADDKVSAAAAPPAVPATPTATATAATSPATAPATAPVTITKIDLRLSNGIEYHAEQITSSALTSLICIHPKMTYPTKLRFRAGWP